MGAEHDAAGPAPSTERRPRRLAAPDVAGPAPVPAAHPGGALPAGPAGRLLRQAGLLAMQRSHGNAFVGRRLVGSGPDSPALQRHPEGFTPTLDPAVAAAEVANPPPLAAATATSGDAAAADPTADGAVTAPPQGATTAEPTAAPAEDAGGAAPTPAADTKPGAPPAPATPTAMSLAKAEEVLTKSYGTVKKIVPGKIELLADRAAMYAKYDQINKGRKNPYNGGQPWKDGDAKTYIPGLDGTADPDTGIVYVNQQTRLATATAHEVLHNNTAAGFAKAVGDTINEGATEYLAIKALKAATVSTASGTAYPGEVGFVTKLVGVVGEDTLIKAYFGGAATLTDAVDKKQGAGTFAKLKPLAEAKNYAEAEKLLKAKAP